jgi:alpha-galactosidase
VTAPAPASLFQTGSVVGTTGYTWAGRTRQKLSVTEPVTVARPVQAPYRTYSSATDAQAVFGESGQQFGIVGAGADLFSGTDAYSSIYLSGAAGNTSTVTTEVTSQQNMTGFAKAGIMVRNDITGSGSTPEGVILLESPSGGIQLEWANNGGSYINSVTPPNGTIPESLPVWLQLQRNGSVYTGYYSYDGSDWLSAGSATVPGQAATQDAGMFLTSHVSGATGEAVFDGFSVASGASPPPSATSYEAEAAANTLAGGAVVASCTACSGGKKVGFVGSGGTLTFNGVTAPSAGTYQVTIAYLDGSATGRQAQISVNGGAPQTV